MKKADKYLRNHKVLFTSVILTMFVILIAGIYGVLYFEKAHSTFENYYAFRGCRKLVQKTDTYAVCKLDTGQAIKIVKYQDKWYLDGDLPCGFLCF